MTLSSSCRAGGLFPEGLRGLVFDVDGVLFDSRASNTQYYNLIRDALGLPPLSGEEEEYCHMASERDSLARIIPPRRQEEAERAGRSVNYRERILPLLRPEPGLAGSLRRLGRWGVRLAVCTNRTDSVADLLRHFRLESFFHPVKTVDNSDPKPAPGGLLAIAREWGVFPRQIAFVGDSPLDQQAAAGAGVPFWSFRNEDLTAQAHFTDFPSLIAWISPLVKRR
ncbi:MAG: HAD family hydrolase [Desulfovibrio sp.]|jgi:phosphoglycolate phosphatase-like HAD superfamily hydrolase|nr:HAD family hydrolase [Desulfovibrio sp.]